MAEGKFTAGVDRVLQTLKQDPDHVQARKLLRVLLQWRPRLPPEPHRLFEAHAERDPAARAELCQEHLMRNPADSDLRTMLAQALLEQGHAAGAAAEAEMAFGDDPKNTVAARTWMDALIRLGRIKEATKIRRMLEERL